MKRFVMMWLAAVLLLTACGTGESGPTWQEQYDLGMRYLSEGNYEEAIVAFTAAIEIDPKRAEAFVGRGDAYVGSGETEENLAAALADYEAALNLDATLANAWLGLANVYLLQEDMENAKDILQEGYDKTGEKALLDKLESIASLEADSGGKERVVERFLADSKEGEFDGELLEADILIFVNRLVPEYEAAYQKANTNEELLIDPFGVSIQNAVSLISGTEILVSEAALDWRAQESVLNSEDLFSAEETPENWREVKGTYVGIPLHAICILTKNDNFQEVCDNMFYPNGSYSICVVWCDKIQ